MQFDVSLWRKRARIRCNSNKKSLRSEYKHISNIEVLVGWCELKGIKVDFRKIRGGIYFAGDNLMIISSMAHPEKQVHNILHECGHHLIGDREQHERFGMGYGIQGTAKRSLVHKIDILDEELEAWHRGLRLTTRLGIKLDKKTYTRYRTQCIKSYARLV